MPTDPRTIEPTGTDSSDAVIQALRGLDTALPRDLERDTVLGVGAADRAAKTDSPIGPVWIAWNPRGVTAVSPVFATKTFDEFAHEHRRRVYEDAKLSGELADAVTDGLDTGRVDGLAVDLSGIAPFQQQVLRACATIPLGQVRPYGWIAAEIGNPGSVRAVGTALGRNPIPLLVPCHRVVRSDGSVGNYAFGPERKHTLLVREGALLA